MSRQKLSSRIKLSALTKAARVAITKRTTPTATDKQKLSCKLWYNNNKKHKSAKNREWYEANINRVLWNKASWWSRKYGVKFNILVEDCKVPEKCPILGLPLKCSMGASADNSPTLDRIDSTKGYTRGNVAVMSRLANGLKGHATAKQHRLIADWMDEQGGSH